MSSVKNDGEITAEPYLEFTPWLLHRDSCHLSPLVSAIHSITHSLTKRIILYTYCALYCDVSVTSLRVTWYPTLATMLLEAHWYKGPNSCGIYTELSPVRDCKIKLVAEGTFWRQWWRYFHQTPPGGDIIIILCRLMLVANDVFAVAGRVMRMQSGPDRKCWVKRSTSGIKRYSSWRRNPKFWCSRNKTKNGV